MNRIKLFFTIYTLIIPTLLIAQSPVAHFTASDTAICDSVYSENFTDQSTNSPTSWKWYFPGATPDTSTIKNPTNIQYKGYGCYTVKLVVKNNNGADSITDSNYICLDAPPHVILTGPNGLCQGSQGTITAYGGTQYYWSTGQTTSAINITGIISETYTVKVVSGACYKDTSFTIEVGTPASWQFLGDTSICVGDSTTIAAIPQSVNYTYLWSTGATTGSIVINGITPGFYTYNLTIDNSGCKDSAKVTVGVQVCTGVNDYSSPNGFAVYPNPGNGVFTIQSSVSNGRLIVYNVLGEKVYQSEINAGNMKINLSGQPQGVYLYRVVTETGDLMGEGKLIVQ